MADHAGPASRFAFNGTRYPRLLVPVTVLLCVMISGAFAPPAAAVDNECPSLPGICCRVELHLIQFVVTDDTENPGLDWWLVATDSGIPFHAGEARPVSFSANGGQTVSRNDFIAHQMFFDRNQSGEEPPPWPKRTLLRADVSEKDATSPPPPPGSDIAFRFESFQRGQNTTSPISLQCDWAPGWDTVESLTVSGRGPNTEGAMEDFTVTVSYRWTITRLA